MKASIEQQQKQQQQQENIINQKEAAIKTLDMQVHKLQSSLDLAVKSVEEAKSDLKAANKVASEAEKRASKLEGQLEVYIGLEKPVKPSKSKGRHEQTD